MMDKLTIAGGFRYICKKCGGARSFGSGKHCYSCYRGQVEDNVLFKKAENINKAIPDFDAPPASAEQIFTRCKSPKFLKEEFLEILQSFVGDCVVDCSEVNGVKMYRSKRY